MPPCLLAPQRGLGAGALRAGEHDDFVSVADLGGDERFDDAFDAAPELGRIVVDGVEDLHGRYPPTNASPNVAPVSR